MFGAIIAASVMLIIVSTTSGNGEDWSLLSEQQFRELYPEFDYFSLYLVPSISKLAGQSATFGITIGAAMSLIRWAFTRDG